jgi:hypothetical protein
LAEVLTVSLPFGSRSGVFTVPGGGGGGDAGAEKEGNWWGSNGCRNVILYQLSDAPTPEVGDTYVIWGGLYGTENYPAFVVEADDISYDVVSHGLGRRTLVITGVGSAPSMTLWARNDGIVVHQILSTLHISYCPDT